MAVDDATTDFQQILKERPNRNNNKSNVNDAGETLHRSMTKNVDQAYETLEVLKVDLEKATQVDTMKSKVSMVVTTIHSKIDIAQGEIETEELLDFERRIQLETKI